MANMTGSERRVASIIREMVEDSRTGKGAISSEVLEAVKKLLASKRVTVVSGIVDEVMAFASDFGIVRKAYAGMINLGSDMTYEILISQSEIERKASNRLLMSFDSITTEAIKA